MSLHKIVSTKIIFLCFLIASGATLGSVRNFVSV